jgi:hypothetical protein
MIHWLSLLWWRIRWCRDLWQSRRLPPVCRSWHLATVTHTDEFTVKAALAMFTRISKKEGKEDESE